MVCSNANLALSFLTANYKSHSDLQSTSHKKEIIKKQKGQNTFHIINIALIFKRKFMPIKSHKYFMHKTKKVANETNDDVLVPLK